MPRTWKAALAPYLAGIPERIGFFGEARFFVLSDIRWGEYKLARMIDRCGVLALDKGDRPMAEWPLPDLVVPEAELKQWLECRERDGAQRPIVAMAPGAVGPGKAWPPEHYAALATALAADGVTVWILGGPNERSSTRASSASRPPNAASGRIWDV